MLLGVYLTERDDVDLTRIWSRREAAYRLLYARGRKENGEVKMPSPSVSHVLSFSLLNALLHWSCGSHQLRDEFGCAWGGGGAFGSGCAISISSVMAIESA